MLPNKTDYSRAKSRIGFFDATTHNGRLLAEGKDALDLLHRMSTNDLRPLFEKPGAGAQTILTNEKGRIVDLLTVINRGSDVLLVTSAGKEQTIISWLDKFTIMEDAKFSHASEKLAQFILLGPRSLDLVRLLIDGDVISMPAFESVAARIGELSFLIQKSLRIAESGWSIFVEAAFADEVRALLVARVLELEGAVLDAATFDALRIEAGMPIAPNELNEKHNPLEAAIVEAVSFTKGCYIGQEVIARLDSFDKVQRHLLGVRAQLTGAGTFAEFENARNVQRAIANEQPFSLPIHGKDGEAVGELTSYAFSPDADCVIGLAYIRTAFANPCESVVIVLPTGGAVPVLLEKLPFEMELA